MFLANLGNKWVSKEILEKNKIFFFFLQLRRDLYCIILDRQILIFFYVLIYADPQFVDFSIIFIKRIFIRRIFSKKIMHFHIPGSRCFFLRNQQNSALLWPLEASKNSGLSTKNIRTECYWCRPWDFLKIEIWRLLKYWNVSQKEKAGVIHSTQWAQCPESRVLSMTV